MAAAIFLLVMWSAPAPVRPICSFPASSNACRSPYGTWSLRWRAATDSTPQTLFVTRVRTGREEKLLTFSGHIVAAWAPDERYLALTEDSDGGDSQVFVADLDAGVVLNVEDEMNRTLKVQAPVSPGGRRYLNALGWQTRSRLTFEVRIYDAAPGREVRSVFTFDVKKRIVR